MALKVPASLVRHLQGGRCVLFAGAGLSAQAKLPSWGKLLGDMVQAVGADDPDEESVAELKKLLEAGRYLDVADECKERLGSGYGELLSRTLQVGSGPVPEAHQLVMRLPFAAWITTNYDKLLEQAHFQVRGSVPKTLTHLDADTFGTLLFDGAPFILKAHGDVDKPESLIFTTKDYREIIHANPAFNAVFSAILLTRAVLFVGYSLNDPDFRLLLDRQLTMFRKFVPERYAVMAGVGDVEREVLRRTAQIKVLSYPAGQHEELVAFLRELDAQVSPRPGETAPEDGKAVASPSRESYRYGPGTKEELEGREPSIPRRSTVPPPASASSKPVDHLGSVSGPSAARGAVDDDLDLLDSDEGGIAGPAFEAFGEEDTSPEPPPQVPPQPLSIPFPATVPTAAGARPRADAAGRKDQPAALTLVLTSQSHHRLAAVLRNGPDEVLAHGLVAFPVGSSPAKFSARAKSAAEYRHVGEDLAELVSPRVFEALEEALGAGAPSIVLSLDAEQETKPWELLQVRGKALSRQAALWRAPVGISDAARGRPVFRRPLRALLIGDPTEELPGAREEVERLEKLYGTGATVLKGRNATVETFISLLGTEAFDIVHFAGHAWYDAQDVYLALAGGARLTDDLIRPGLSHHPPGIVMLNSHYTAFMPPGVSDGQGSETLKATSSGRIGFTEVAMRAGVGAFVGCFGSPSDGGAAALAVAFHRALLDGVPVSEALHRARNDGTIARDDPTPLLYALSGYGDLSLE